MTTLLRLRRLARRPVGLALVYHSLADRTGDPERELVPAHGVDLFEAQLRFCAANFELVRASDLLRAVLDRRRGRRLPLAITFDDDLSSHAQVALPLLRQTDASATFFLCGASLEAPHRFWWERMQAAFDEGQGDAVQRIVRAHSDEAAVGAGRPTIHDLAGAVERLGSSAQDQVAAELESLAGPDLDDSGMRAAEVSALAEAGFEIGFHTLWHRQLPSLEDTELVDAMREGRGRLEGLAGADLSATAYPHGKADPRVTTAAREAGFSFGFTTAPNSVGSRSSPWLLGRIEPSFESVSELARQLGRALDG